MVIIDQEKCIGCGMCAADCSVLNIDIKDKKAHVKKECFQCGHCVSICPAGAVSIPDYDMNDVEEFDKETFCLEPEKVLHSIKFRRSIRKYKPEKIKKRIAGNAFTGRPLHRYCQKQSGLLFRFRPKRTGTVKNHGLGFYRQYGKTGRPSYCKRAPSVCIL